MTTISSQTEGGSVSVNKEDHAIRVMVVDDSVVIREFFSKILEENDDVKLEARASNGQIALDRLKMTPVDVIILDIEMPVMDGLTALPKLLEIDPHVKIIVASTLTKKNATTTLEALEKGAAECLAKPSTMQELNSVEEFKTNLLMKVVALGRAARLKKMAVAAQPKTDAVVDHQKIEPIKTPAPAIELKTDTLIRRPQAIAIGSSTGGPQALFKVLSHLNKGVVQPIFLTQHMPPTFTSVLAEHISKQSDIDCKEAENDEVVQGGRVYLAPGGYHMLFKKDDTGQVRVVLDQGPPENFCRPAVDPMLRSLIEVYGASILAVILTGMGYDGQKSCVSLSEKGGMVMAQDERTSVVWGMPKAVAEKGICFDVKPLDEIGPKMREIASL